MNIGMWLQYIVFFVFSITLIFASLCVITSNNPVRGVLFLVLAFFCSSVLWILLHAEFLGLILILVYVGAVMTLFLFVVMMLDIDLVPRQQGFVRYLPLGVIVFAVLVGIMVWAIWPQHYQFVAVANHADAQPANLSNVKAIGMTLFTDYLYPFELAGILLLVAMISAISLAFRGRRQTTKSQAPSGQVKVSRDQRVRIVKMASEKKPSAGNDTDDK